jgi:hypothetical protein
MFSSHCVDIFLLRDADGEACPVLQASPPRRADKGRNWKSFLFAFLDNEDVELEMQGEHERTSHFQNDKKTNSGYFELHIHASRHKNSQLFI